MFLKSICRLSLGSLILLVGMYSVIDYIMEESLDLCC